MQHPHVTFASPLLLSLLLAYAPAQAACLSEAQVDAMMVAYATRTPAVTPEGLSQADGECTRA